MLTDKDYMQIISEVYDISSYAKKKELIFCNEAEKNQKVESIVTKLYQYIKNNITDIDFGNIPKSKGIISKVDNYDQMIACLNSIQDLVSEYKDPTNTVKELSTCIENIKNREKEFSKAFALNIEFPIMLYNITVLSIVSSVSLLIASSIEYIKNGHQSFKMAFDKVGYRKTKDHLTFEYVSQFNRNCKDGTIDKFINGCIKYNLISTKESTLSEVGIADMSSFAQTAANIGVGAATFQLGVGASAPIMIISLIISIGMTAWSLLKMIRKLIALFLRMRMAVSDWFALQAELLSVNAENLRYREDAYGDAHRDKVYQRQVKWANRFKAISNFVLVKDFKANTELAREEIARDNDYEDSTPPPTGQGLF